MLSIIVMTRNEEKNIGSFLQSIVLQKYSGVFEIKIDNKSVLINSGKVDGVKCDLEFELPDTKKSIKAEWSREDIVKFGTRELPNGLPLEITIDKTQSHKLHYKDKRLYEAGQSEPWSQLDTTAWWAVFSKMGRGATALADVNLDTILVETKDLQDWAGCVASFTGAGAGIGAAAGFAGGGLAGATTGGIAGSVFGGVFGAGYCTAEEMNR